MSKSKHKAVFKLGLRVAFYSALFSSLLVFLLLNFFVDGAEGVSYASAAVTFGSVFIIAYSVEYKIQQRRLNVLNRITKNLAKKRFKEYEDITTPYNDEVDYLVKQTIRASKMVEKEIQRLNQIENYRKEFIGDISHELKTPIFAIQGFLETLLNGALDDEEVNRDFLKKAMRNVNRLIYLTKDLMEISKLETGELKSSIEEVYLRDLVHDVVESLNYKAQKETVNIIVHDISEKLKVHADRNQIKQVLINLIENGIKYNKEGGTVNIGVKEYPKNVSKVLLFVEDNGIGIDKHDLERVTERFFRVDKSRSREKGGTGLGLSIVKHIMEAHGEQFYIESEVNKGTKVSFTLRKVEPAPVIAQKV